MSCVWVYRVHYMTPTQTMHFSKSKSTTINLHLHCLVLPCHIICHSAVCFRFRSDVAPASLPLSLARWQHRLRSLQFQLAKLSSEGQMIIIFHQPSHCPEIRGFPKLNHAWWVEVVCSVAINLTRKHVFFFQSPQLPLFLFDACTTP